MKLLQPACACLAAGVALLGVSAKAIAAMEVDEPPTLSGSYLAARSADVARDIQAAAGFYGEALADDPKNPALVERVLILKLASGDVDQAFGPAEKLIEIDNGNPIARLALAMRSIKQKDYASVSASLATVAKAPLATLTIGLINAWIDFADGKTDDALTTIKALSGPNWYGIFKDYHTALILDAAGRTSDAATAIARAYATDASALRVVEGYARIMARAGKREIAIKALTDFAGADPLHPTIATLLADIRGGKPIAPTAATVDAGVAEALYGLGSAIGADDGPELPIAYLNLSLYLDPTLRLASMSIGDILQAAGRCDEAMQVYDRVPAGDPLRRNADLQIGNCLETLGRHDEAAARVKAVLDAAPSDIEAAVALGNIYRAADKYAEAADAYGKALAATKKETPDDWRIYYYRGVALERSKQWPAAEADFQHALKLNPDQPQVLNYLGYSWVDMGMQLDKALDMIKSAVDLRPNDGYIVDSLGWAHYRMGQYQQAVESLERAIELRPEDSTINDHLGDAYWQVGRKREATFQWAHARDLNPEKDQLPKIVDKLKHGLTEVPSVSGKMGGEVQPAAPASSDPAAPKPISITVGKGESLWTIANKIYGNAGLYDLIFRANRDQIRNPDRIFPGMTLSVPGRESQ
jgi:tetratricopeptide (TPR) repeat protein